MTPKRSRKRRLRKKKNYRKKIITIIAIFVIIFTLIVGYILLTDNSSNQNGNNVTTQMKVLLETNMGNILIQLRDDMPITTNNFRNLVKNDIYDGTIFHRVISAFMIQGGDPTGTGFGDPSIPKIPDEFTDTNENNRGTIAMANAGANTGSSQFFINVVNNNGLDGAHPVFGVVIDGMDIVDSISNVQTDLVEFIEAGVRNPDFNKPLEDVIIIRAMLID